MKEVKGHSGNCPYLLVGCKIDIREDEDALKKLSEEGITPLEPQDGQKVAREIGAAGFVECSALSQEGLKHVFDEAITIAWRKKKRGRKPKKKFCQS